MAVTIDVAIEMLAARGRPVAATFLEASGARFSVIVRVMGEPGRRRAPSRLNVLPLPRLQP